MTKSNARKKKLEKITENFHFTNEKRDLGRRGRKEHVFQTSMIM